MGIHSDRGMELLDMIAAIVDEEAVQGLAHLGQRVASRIAVTCGGQRVYFPFDRARRNARIYNEYTGANIPHLAARYHLSEPTVNQIIRDERAKRRVKQHAWPIKCPPDSS